MAETIDRPEVGGESVHKGDLLLCNGQLFEVSLACEDGMILATDGGLYLATDCERPDSLEVALVDAGNVDGVIKAVYDTVLAPIVSDLTDEQVVSMAMLWPAWSNSAAYSVGDLVTYASNVYRCLQAHTAQEDWTPTDAVSLWAQVLIVDPDVIPEWVQPDSTNPYMTGDRVTHNGSTWESLVDNNVWEPGVYGWDEVA